jgi:hypothetical protein
MWLSALIRAMWDLLGCLADYKAEAVDIIKGERIGQIDFAIRCKPIIFIEWNGPGLYQPKDVAKDMLKLLSQDKSYLKVFAAIITSSRTGRSDHMLAVRKYLETGLKFAFDVLGINHPIDKNLYIYVATVTKKPVKIHWGSYVKRGL